MFYGIWVFVLVGEKLYLLICLWDLMGDLIWVGIEWTWVLKDLLDRERGSLIALIFGYCVGFNLSA